MPADLEKLKAELSRTDRLDTNGDPVYPSLIAAGDHAGIAAYGNALTVAGDVYIALDDLINILGTYLAIPALGRDADNEQSATKDFSATLLWQMERKVIKQFRADNPAVQQGFAALTAEGVLSADCVTALNAASKPEMRSPFQAAGIVGPGETVSGEEVTWSWGA